MQAGVDTLRIKIAGSPEFHRLHWEALKDPKLPQAFALQAPMVRKNLMPQPVRATFRASPTINLLIVTARPGGKRDVGYRTISRPLVEGLRRPKCPSTSIFCGPARTKRSFSIWRAFKIGTARVTTT